MRPISLILLLFAFSSCVKTGSEQPDNTFQYASFRDIPGVTAEEIKVIEELQKKGVPLVYGTPLSTEAFINEEGEIGGFAVLLCEWLSGLFGLQFKTEIDNLTDILDRLKTGEVSIGALTASEDRMKTYFMTSPIIHRSTKIMRIKGRPSHSEIVLTRPVRYLFMEGTTLKDAVTSALAPGSYHAAAERDHETIYKMLLRAEADVYIANNIVESAFDIYGGVVTEDFLPLIITPVSLAAKDPAFSAVISVVTKALDCGAYKHITELYRQGYYGYKRNAFLTRLSAEEREYVRNTPVIPFAAQFMSYPVSFYNVNEKKWEGIIFDVLDEMEKLTGFDFKLVNDENTELPELMNLLENGTAYIMPNLIQSDERRKRFIWPDTVYLTDKFALLSKRSYPNVELNDIPFTRVGYARASAFGDLFKNWFPNAMYAIEYPGTDEAFMAVERGEIDMVMSSQSRLAALTNYYEYSDYKANYIFNSAFDASFGLNKDQTVLCSIIDKALPHIDTGRIAEQWTSRTYNIETMRLRNQRPWLLGSIVLIFCVLILLVVLFERSRLAGKRLEKIVKDRTYAAELQTATLTTLLDSIPDLIFTKDLKLNFILCNKSFLAYFNKRKEDVVGKIDNDAFGLNDETAEKFLRWDRRVINENKTFAIEEPLPRSDGTWPLYETIKTPLVLDGEVIGLLAIGRDITKRKEIERELALQTATLTTLFDSIPDFIFIMNTSLRFTQCNKSFLDHFGLTREDIIDKGEDGLRISAELTEEHNTWNRKVINEGRKFAFEERIPGADGTNPLYETVKAPLVLNGEIIGLLGISHDITKRKEMEDAALSASRSKSVFLANMSHEIRTPMNSIIGFSELALDGETSPRTSEYLAKIKVSAEWLLQIINDILDISKIESGRMELEQIPFDMHELFASCRTLIMPKAEEKGITLHFYAEPSIGKKPLGDPTRLRQVLVNLLSNAVKFTNTGTVKVLAQILHKDKNTVTMQFEIKDSGIGMTAEQIAKIFDPFTQAETGTTRQYGGTGLGLSITKNMLELMGGKLSVESTPGVGSKFSFNLTFDTIDVAEEIPDQKIVFNELEKPTFEGEILLCEDNVMNQQVISEHLARVGLKTIVAENGKIGVELVQNRMNSGKKQFDLIFMDMHMPVMDGIEASAKIIELNTGIPIVAMTANIMSSDREIYKQSGMNDCVGKPFTSQELWRCLHKYLKPANGITASQKKPPANDVPIDYDLEFKKTLQKMFLKSNPTKIAEITKALQDGDIKLAHRLVHTLKGNAAQIGMTALQKIAAEIENQLKGEENLVTQEQMALLKKELDAALLELAENAPSSETENVRAKTLDTAAMRELFEKLEPMLSRGDPDSLQYADTLRALSGSERLIRQIEDYDFESAVFSLAELKEKLEKGEQYG